jgi:hypothetical protein
MSGIKTVTHVEWLRRGRELFGKDFMKWRFVCPVCGNVATVEDFQQYKDKGANPNGATCECIGRYSGKGGPAVFEGRKVSAKPCEYAGYGLLRLSPVRIMEDLDGEEEEAHCFAFDENA